ncbi:hypothetical protein E2I00_007922 [Balaenoptera physalus]|uniref:Uncharacterized protein n=1 Tax=Balaenoptera physalus TaxID=9770 RepID=A0A643BSM3_BALPH|nr:hypothetical protein E2I00_007922 [Balaenoptera physalus]
MAFSTRSVGRLLGPVSVTEDTDKANMCLFSSPTPNLLWRGAVEKENGDPREPRGKGMEKTDGQRRARCISRNTAKCD